MADSNKRVDGTPRRGGVVSRSLLVQMVNTNDLSLIDAVKRCAPTLRLLVGGFTVLGAMRLLNISPPGLPSSRGQIIDRFIGANFLPLQIVFPGSAEIPAYELARENAKLDDWELFALCLAAREGYDYLCHGDEDIGFAAVSGLGVRCHLVGSQ
jgi:hypothetical protein